MNQIRYVADSGDHTVRKLDPTSGMADVLVGESGVPGSEDGPRGSAHLMAPTAITADDVGNLYVLEPYLGVIRRVDLRSQIVRTFTDRGRSHFDRLSPADGVALPRRQ
jgi:hypothetical protein